LETSIGAVARLKQLEADIKPEAFPSEASKPPENWPKDGAVSFHNVSASYKANSSPVLHEINLEIRAGEKIGLSGRTDSGKSTMIGLLFRLAPEHTGTITIDDQDLSLLPREEIRSSIITIPQEPFLLSGSVRFNATPLTANIMSEAESQRFKAPEAAMITSSNLIQPVSDETIIGALKRVSLWDQVERSGGLSEPIDCVGLSHGQKQHTKRDCFNPRVIPSRPLRIVINKALPPTLTPVRHPHLWQLSVLSRLFLPLLQYSISRIVPRSFPLIVIDEVRSPLTFVVVELAQSFPTSRRGASLEG
jgi:ABC-type transport system involved in cytochrome bd biosynthesis fused ATPase/permease subunit